MVRPEVPVNSVRTVVARFVTIFWRHLVLCFLVVRDARLSKNIVRLRVNAISELPCASAGSSPRLVITTGGAGWRDDATG